MHTQCGYWEFIRKKIIVSKVRTQVIAQCVAECTKVKPCHLLGTPQWKWAIVMKTTAYTVLVSAMAKLHLATYMYTMYCIMTSTCSFHSTISLTEMIQFCFFSVLHVTGLQHLHLYIQVSPSSWPKYIEQCVHVQPNRLKATT